MTNFNQIVDRMGEAPYLSYDIKFDCSNCGEK